MIDPQKGILTLQDQQLKQNKTEDDKMKTGSQLNLYSTTKNFQSNSGFQQ